MENEIVYISGLIGDPVRSKILWTLMDGKAYTATELSISAETSPQNISMHLSKLVQADLLKVASQGRYKYYRFSRDEVAYAIEAIANLIHPEHLKKISSNPTDSPIRYCRTCYDHLAGRVGVLMTESLLKKGVIQQRDNGFVITNKSRKFFEHLGINISILQTGRRIFAKPCLDWSERKYHLAGSLGAALLEKMLLLDWLRKNKNSRAITLTSKGRKALYDVFCIAV